MASKEPTGPRCHTSPWNQWGSVTRSSVRFQKLPRERQVLGSGQGPSPNAVIQVHQTCRLKLSGRRPSQGGLRSRTISLKRFAGNITYSVGYGLWTSGQESSSIRRVSADSRSHVCGGIHGSTKLALLLKGMAGVSFFAGVALVFLKFTGDWRHADSRRMPVK